MKFCSTLVGWTSAALTCLTVPTFHKHFSHYKRRNHSTGVKGASDNNLGLYGVNTLPISYKGKIIEGKFVLCSNLDVDLLGIDIINELGISYDAKTQDVFSIADVPDTGEVLIPAFSTSVITVKNTVEITPSQLEWPPSHHPATGTLPDVWPWSSWIITEFVR